MKCLWYHRCRKCVYAFFGYDLMVISQNPRENISDYRLRTEVLLASSHLVTEYTDKQANSLKAQNLVTTFEPIPPFLSLLASCVYNVLCFCNHVRSHTKSVGVQSLSLKRSRNSMQQKFHNNIFLSVEILQNLRLCFN